MAVGINGMGRIGRLTLRAAMGGVDRDVSDPLCDARLDVAHVNEISGGIETTAHLVEPGLVVARGASFILASSQS